MKKIVDACGLSCPEPVLKLKQVIDGADDIEMTVDSQVCVENCTRFAESKGFTVSVTKGKPEKSAIIATPPSYTMKIRKDTKKK